MRELGDCAADEVRRDARVGVEQQHELAVAAGYALVVGAREAGVGLVADEEVGAEGVQDGAVKAGARVVDEDELDIRIVLGAHALQAVGEVTLRPEIHDDYRNKPSLHGRIIPCSEREGGRDKGKGVRGKFQMSTPG
jgi:hypothetical protein